MTTRKTIPVSEIRDMVNRMLQTPDSTLYLQAPGKDRELTPAEALRIGAISVLEQILHKTGNYHGFGYQTDTVVSIAENPGEQTVITDETRRIYYR